MHQARWVQVVSLPYFEWVDLETLEQQQAYVKAKLDMPAESAAIMVDNLPDTAAVAVAEAQKEVDTGVEVAT